CEPGVVTCCLGLTLCRQQLSRSMARSSPRLPGRDRAINLQLASLAKEWSNRIHHLNSRDSLDRRRVRELVMRLPSSQPDHRAFEQLRDAIDDVAVGHR